VTLAQQAVEDKTNAIAVALEGRRHRVLEGRSVTLDALLTQRQIAQQSGDAGGNSGRVGTAHQPHVWEAIATVCALAPSAGERRTAAATLDCGHGRSEQRGLPTRTGWMGESDWPALAHVLHLERQVLIKNTGAVREAVGASVTSLAPEQADAARLLALVRGPWQIEHQAHGGRDVTFEADRSQVRCGHIPQVTAALRHPVMGFMRGAGSTNIAAAGRRVAAQPRAAWSLIGIALEN